MPTGARQGRGAGSLFHAMSAEPQNAPAPMFAGKYRLVRILGKGAMGEVWLAEEEGPRNFRRKVAVKRLLTATEIPDIATESFIAEAQVIARIDHPNVVRLVELGSADGGLYLVLDYVDGAALDRIIKKGGALSPKAVAYIGREVARALEAVHSMCDEHGKNYGVVHRDVSPSNILISRDGRVRLSDFGVARISGLGGEKTETGVFKGKLPYMPPEQARGEPFDGRADIFSLGVTLFEALLGGRLRRAETQAQLIMKIATERVAKVHERIPGAPQILARAIDQATEFTSDARTPDAGELASELDEALRSFGPRSDRDAREELKEFVATVTGVPNTGAVPAAMQSGSGRAAGPASARVPHPSNHPPAWSVPLGPPLGDRPPEEGSNPTHPSARSYGSAPAVAISDAPLPSVRTGEPEPEEPTLMRASPGFSTGVGSVTSQSPASLAPRKSSTPVVIAGVIVVAGVAAGALLLLRRAPTETTSPAASATVVTASGPIASTPTADPAPSAPVVEATAKPPASAAAADPTGKATSKPGDKSPGPRTPAVPSTATAKASGGEDESAGPGTLQVVVLPWAEVSVDGRGVGTTPIAPLPLPPGPHSVVLRNSELGASRSMSVTIKAGKPTLLRVDLRRTE